MTLVRASDRFVAFDDLPALPSIGYRHSWDCFGRGDNLGTLNWLTAERTAAATREVRTGEVVNLNLPLSEPDPPLFGRRPTRHVVESHGRNRFEDKLDDFYLQSTTQWDGLLHQRAREFGFYGGRTEEPVAGQEALGVDHWARHGIVGRGVLIDIPRHMASLGRDYDPFGRFTITVADLEAILESQGVALRPGDLLCFRFGWTDGWLRSGPDERTAYEERLRLAGTRTFAGLSADEGMSRFLWNHQVVGLACDNPAVEVSPGDPAIGSLHRRLLPCLGFMLGELFDLGDLAERCAAREQWTFLFTSAPLYVVGGVGTPANAYAVL